MTEDAFLGVPADVLHGLGMVSVAAGRLEGAARAMLVDLYVDPGKLQVKDSLKEIRRAVRRGLPAHATADAAAIIGWSEDVGRLIEDRHPFFHSSAGSVFESDAWVPMATHLRSGRRIALRADELRDLAQRLADLWKRGNDLGLALRHQPRAGVFLPNSMIDDSWTPTCVMIDADIWPERPSPEELDVWWRDLGPIPDLRSSS